VTLDEWDAGGYAYLRPVCSACKRPVRWAGCVVHAEGADEVACLKSGTLKVEVAL
jgi:butyrate kinase